ncbi:MAG TPA: PspC domain-containing protein [Candidatus Acidoferrales bacterium]|nr:PspC domain-containing protein [Candidatus Acidoferrales bacterium]
MESSTNVTSTPARLYRSANDKVIAGVCGGLASYFKIDPALVRLAFLVFALAGGASILLYLVLWVAVPLGETSAAAAPRYSGEVVAIGLIAVGGVWLLANFGAFRFINWSVGWPLVLVAVGVALLLRRS